MDKIKSLNNLAKFADYSLIDNLKCDPDSKVNGIDHSPREVFSGHYVSVKPTAIETPIYIIHSKSFFEELGLDDSRAMWWSITATDLDNDGDEDYIVGNLGKNNKFKASKEHPFKLYANDFDNNGTNDVVLSKFYKDDYVPLRGRECTSQQMPFVAEKFKDYHSFASSKLLEILPEDKVDDAVIYEINSFESIILINEGSKLIKKSLPIQAQVSPIKSALVFDVDIEKPVYKIGFLAQVYTATIVLRLIEEGGLALEEKLSKFYPNIDGANKITIEDLIKHQSGIPDMRDDPDFEEYAIHEHTEQELIGRIEKYERETIAANGSNDSSTNYVLLAYIAQKCTSQTYSELLSRYITAPLGLKYTYVYDSMNPGPHEVENFIKTTRWEGVEKLHESVVLGAEAIVSKPSEVAIFIRAILKGELLQDRKLFLKNLFMKDRVTYSDKSFYAISSDRDKKKTIVIYNEDEDLVVVSLSNALLIDSGKVMRAISAAYFGQSFKLPTLRTKVEVKMRTLDQYVGTYGSDEFPYKLVFKNSKGVLVGLASSHSRSEVPFEAISETTFKLASSGINLEFREEGEVLIFTQGKSFKLKKIRY